MPKPQPNPNERREGRWIVDARTGERIRMASVSELMIVHDGKTTFGKRWNVAGVTYPEEVLSSSKVNRSGGKNNPKDTAPSGYITTRAAAAILNSSGSSARDVLHRHKVRHVLVRSAGGPHYLYWLKKAVEAIAAKRDPVVSTPPAGCIDSATARKRLGIGRSTLFRYEQKGLLPVQHVRLLTKKGTRNKDFYRVEDVEALVDQTRRIREAQSHLDSLLRGRYPVNHLNRDNTQPPPPTAR